MILFRLKLQTAQPAVAAPQLNSDAAARLRLSSVQECESSFHRIDRSGSGRLTRYCTTAWGSELV